MVRTTFPALVLIATAAPLAAQTKAPATTSAAAPTIAKEQWLSRAEAEFTRVDTNKDGQMSRAEIETFQTAAAKRMMAERNKAVFTALDTDKNGQISAAEFGKLNNDNPKVDVSDVMSIDTNKDGKISLAEHKAATLDTFTKVDTNKDGMLTATEIQALAKN